MNLGHYIRTLKEYVCKERPAGNDGASVLSMLYMCYADSNRNEMPLQEVDRVIYPVCTLCRDHEKAGFIHGVQVGLRLADEIGK